MKFKVGDRVRVYVPYGSECGEVTKIYSEWMIYVHFDEGEFLGGDSGVTVHPKQCRHLKPKKKPEQKFPEFIWVPIKIDVKDIPTQGNLLNWLAVEISNGVLKYKLVTGENDATKKGI